jgi:hypothetical protein
MAPRRLPTGAELRAMQTRYQIVKQDLHVLWAESMGVPDAPHPSQLFNQMLEILIGLALDNGVAKAQVMADISDTTGAIGAGCFDRN